jgi:hypothetical protein
VVGACFVGVGSESAAVLLVLVFLGQPMSRRRCGWFFFHWDGKSMGGGVGGSCFFEAAMCRWWIVAACE